jgi:hypothetical protein
MKILRNFFLLFPKGFEPTDSLQYRPASEAESRQRKKDEFLDSCETRKFIIITVIIIEDFISKFSMGSFLAREVECTKSPSKHLQLFNSQKGVTSRKTSAPYYYLDTSTAYFYYL